MTLSDRILHVLKKEGLECIHPHRRRAVDRLFLDDGNIPQSGIRLMIALWRLRRKGLIHLSNGYISALTTEKNGG